jgi:hypothetical protein
MTITNPSLDMEVLAFAGIKLCNTSATTPDLAVLEHSMDMDNKDVVAMMSYIRRNHGQLIVYNSGLYVIFKTPKECKDFRRFLRDLDSRLGACSEWI